MKIFVVFKYLYIVINLLFLIIIIYIESFKFWFYNFIFESLNGILKYKVFSVGVIIIRKYLEGKSIDLMVNKNDLFLYN